MSKKVINFQLLPFFLMSTFYSNLIYLLLKRKNKSELITGIFAKNFTFDFFQVLYNKQKRV